MLFKNPWLGEDANGWFIRWNTKFYTLGLDFRKAVHSQFPGASLSCWERCDRGNKLHVVIWIIVLWMRAKLQICTPPVTGTPSRCSQDIKLLELCPPGAAWFAGRAKLINQEKENQTVWEQNIAGKDTPGYQFQEQKFLGKSHFNGFVCGISEVFCFPSCLLQEFFRGDNSCIALPGCSAPAAPLTSLLAGDAFKGLSTLSGNKWASLFVCTRCCFSHFSF